MTALNQSKPAIPEWLIWIQCIAFVVLYAFWILPEIVGVRNTALVIGALAGLYPIYQYRALLWTKRAIPIWLMVALFVWATFHLFFLSQDFTLQYLEYKRIWKYAAIGSIFAIGLGLSLAGTTQHQSLNPSNPGGAYWTMIYLGLCAPVLIYLLKYVLRTYGAKWGIQTPPYLQIYFSSTTYYVPKTDYVAFCLPPLAIALGQIKALVDSKARWASKQYVLAFACITLVAATLFLFYFQNIKNGMAYAAICISLFLLMMSLQMWVGNWLKKLLILLAIMGCLILALYPHIQKNDTWRTLFADTRVAFQLDNYQQWKYAGEKGYPNNEFGTMVSVTTYERAAWFKVGLILAKDMPLGYGLVEDSFKKMARARWPEVSPNLSHSHSGWLDVILATGIPGFILLIATLCINLVQAKKIAQPWRSLVRWSLFSLGMLWITTEVSATVTFASLVFWLSWSAGLTVQQSLSN